MFVIQMGDSWFTKNLFTKNLLIEVKMSPPGPPKQFDREEALCCGMRLFWKRGYANVSLNDLLREMQIGRQSFYNAFTSKADLFEEAVQYYADRYLRESLAKLSHGGSPQKNVVEFLSNWESSAAKKPNDGCFLVNARGDFPCLREEAINIVRTTNQQIEQALADEIERALAQQEISSELSAARLAQIITTLGNGMMVAARDCANAALPKGLLSETYRLLAPPSVSSR